MRTTQRVRTQGFSLIEVLVALFITAIGVLGIAAIILFSLRASFESREQSIAALLAIDVHERAWLSAHEASTCMQDWIDLATFAPDRTDDNGDTTMDDYITAAIEDNWPNCIFTVEWDQDEVGVVGGMFRLGGEFGGTYTHNFTIPSTMSSGN